jgi:hypothetical protein
VDQAGCGGSLTVDEVAKEGCGVPGWDVFAQGGC